MVRKIMSDVEARFILDQYVRQLPALFVINSFCEWRHSAAACGLLSVACYGESVAIITEKLTD